MTYRVKNHQNVAVQLFISVVHHFHSGGKRLKFAIQECGGQPHYSESNLAKGTKNPRPVIIKNSAHSSVSEYTPTTKCEQTCTLRKLGERKDNKP
jgi:hypothetical protein